MQRVFQRLDAVGRGRAPACDGADVLDDGDDLGVEGSVLTQGEVHGLAAADELGQLGREALDGEGLLRTEERDRAFGAVATTVPDLALRVARAHEQHELGRLALGILSAWRDDGDGIGLGEAGEVGEVGVLPEAMVRVARADMLVRGGDDGDAVAADAAHQFRATRAVFRELMVIGAHGDGPPQCTGEFFWRSAARACAPGESSMKISCTPTRTYSTSSA